MKTNSQAPRNCQVLPKFLSHKHGHRDCRADDARHGVTRGKKNPLYQQVSRRLVHLRNAAELTLTELGDLAAVHHTTVFAIERAEGTSRISTIEQLATALGISPVYLAFGEDGHLRWKERHPRFGLDPDPPPAPAPAARPCPNLYGTMGERLRLARAAKGLSMRALGRVAGCTVAAISLLEAGTSVVLLSTCEDLAKALDVSPGWLAYGIGAGPAPN